MNPVRLLSLVAATLLMGGCAKKENAPAANDPAVDVPAVKHVHTAPHGGTLVEIGEHSYLVEFVRDAASGKLSAYILDGHAENFIRINVPSFDVIATLNGTTKTVTLNAVADPATGEKSGDSATFQGQAEWLKTTPVFDASIARLNIRGTSVLDVAFNFPAGNEVP